MFKKKKSSAGSRRNSVQASSKNKAIFSYYQNRDNSSSDSSAGRNQTFMSKVKHWLQRVPTLIAVALLIISGLWVLSLSSTPRVTVVNEQNVASSVILRPTKEYQSAAKKLLDQTPITRNKLLLDAGGIEKAMQEQFSEITNVAVVLPLISRTPVVYVQVAEPVLVLENGSSRYVIDEKGRSVIAANQVQDIDNLHLINVKDAANLALQPGNQVLTGNDVEFMKTVKDQLAGKGITVSRMELPQQASDVHVFIDDSPYYLKLTTTADVQQQIGSFLALNDYLKGKQVTPAEYIDLRVPERAYYK